MSDPAPALRSSAETSVHPLHSPEASPPQRGDARVLRGRFPVFLIKPSHYDDDGYVIRWRRTVIPSNTLATLYGLVLDCAERRVLGPEVSIEPIPLDETNTRIDVEAIIRAIEAAGMGFVGLIGVQSNQYPRALDLARRFRARRIPVVIGGFHVSGSLAMLPGVQPDLKAAVDLGITLYAGEAEGRLEGLLRDVAHGTLSPIYDHLADLPGLESQPVPFLPRERLLRSVGTQTSFDAGRGCPFQCSFCTIINVQGRKSRRRTADDIERIVRRNVAQDVRNFFITDDNFARNRNWEEILDRLIELRRGEKLKFRITIQVDTLCHKIPGFIEKARRAGVNKVFVGLESIDPEALKGTGKRQNQLSEYRAMMDAWHAQGVIICAGYIIGFPGDTPESIRRDIRTIQREIPVDILEFFVLTPLPGSQDHKELFHAGVPMDPDMNRYDTFHVTTAHARMSAEEWERAYWDAWRDYYSPEHMERLLERAQAYGIKTRKMANMAIWFHGCSAIEGVHPLDGGYLRVKRRDERRPELPREGFLAFHLRYGWELVAKHARYLRLVLRLRRFTRRLERGPRSATEPAPKAASKPA